SSPASSVRPIFGCAASLAPRMFRQGELRTRVVLRARSAEFARNGVGTKESTGPSKRTRRFRKKRQLYLARTACEEHPASREEEQPARRERRHVNAGCREYGCRSRRDGGGGAVREEQTPHVKRVARRRKVT